jgi:hypothetical protein
MPDGHNDSTLRDLLEHERAEAVCGPARTRAVSGIAVQAPGHLITTEHYPGRRERFVAKAVSSMVHPHLVMTDDLDELFIDLVGPVREDPDH